MTMQEMEGGRMYSGRRRRLFSFNLTRGTNFVSISKISTQFIQYTHESSRFKFHHLRYNLYPVWFLVFPLSDFQGRNQMQQRLRK